MSYFINICLICLKSSNNLKHIKLQDANGISFEDKLSDFLPEYELNLNIPTYICAQCGRNLNRIHKFKQKCLESKIAYKKYAQQITTTDSSYKYLSVFIGPNSLSKDNRNVLQSKCGNGVSITEELKASLPDIKQENCDTCSDLMCEEANIFDKNNHDTPDPLCVKEELSDEFIPQSHCEINVDVVNIEEFINKEKTDKLVVNDELASLVHEIRKENPQLHDKFQQIGKIFDENVQISENISKQGEKEQYNHRTNHENTLKNHIQLWDIHKKKSYECKICNKLFLNPQELQRHTLKHSKEKPFTCEICKKSYQHLKSLKIHNLKHSNKKPYKCEVCNKLYSQLSSLKAHRLSHSDKKPFPCDVCDKSFVVLSTLKKHKLIHTGERKFTCEVCSKSFKTSFDLKRHERIHTGEKPFTCEICNKSFADQSATYKHKRIHSGEKPYTCEICNKSFRQPQVLSQHKLVHTGEKPHTCKVCNESFRLSVQLKLHNIKHTGEKSFVCEVCNKSFGMLHHLKQHKMIHTGEKPFTCEVCNKSFRQAQKLRHHKLLHTGGKFTCEVCHKSFGQAQALEEHKLMHIGGTE